MKIVQRIYNHHFEICLKIFRLAFSVVLCSSDPLFCIRAKQNISGCTSGFLVIWVDYIKKMILKDHFPLIIFVQVWSLSGFWWDMLLPVSEVIDQPKWALMVPLNSLWGHYEGMQFVNITLEGIYKVSMLARLLHVYWVLQVDLTFSVILYPNGQGSHIYNTNVQLNILLYMKILLFSYS